MTTDPDDLDVQEKHIRKRVGHYTRRASSGVWKGVKKGVKSSYRASHVGQDLSKLGGSLMDTVVGLPIRAARGIVNFANYAARAVVGAPEAGAKKLYRMVEGVEESLDDKVRAAEKHHGRTITLSRGEIEFIQTYGPHTAIPHLDAKIRQAEEEQRQVHIPLPEAHKVLAYIQQHGTTDILNRYKRAAAIVSFVVALLSFDQVRLTGAAVSTIHGGYDYYSLFGFLFLALGILLLCMHRRR